MTMTPRDVIRLLAVLHEDGRITAYEKGYAGKRYARTGHLVVRFKDATVVKGLDAVLAVRRAHLEEKV